MLKEPIKKNNEKDMEGPFPHLQIRILKELSGFYEKDPKALFPANELISLQKLNPDDLDAVLVCPYGAIGAQPKEQALPPFRFIQRE